LNPGIALSAIFQESPTTGSCASPPRGRRCNRRSAQGSARPRSCSRAAATSY